MSLYESLVITLKPKENVTVILEHAPPRWSISCLWSICNLFLMLKCLVHLILSSVFSIFSVNIKWWQLFTFLFGSSSTSQSSSRIPHFLRLAHNPLGVRHSVNTVEASSHCVFPGALRVPEQEWRAGHVLFSVILCFKCTKTVLLRLFLAGNSEQTQPYIPI